MKFDLIGGMIIIADTGIAYLVFILLNLVGLSAKEFIFL